MMRALLSGATIPLTVSLASAASIPPGADGAEKALAASTRHGEWVGAAGGVIRLGDRPERAA